MISPSNFKNGRETCPEIGYESKEFYCPSLDIE